MPTTRATRTTWTPLLTALILWAAGTAIAYPPPGGNPGNGNGNGNGGGGGDGGGGGEPLTGTVYYRNVGTHELYTMSPEGINPDRTGETELPLNVYGDWVSNDPSRHLHGGHRWFLAVRDTPGLFYPYDPFPDDGVAELTTRRELFAVRDDGNEAFTVQLTDQPDLEIFRAGVGATRWGVGDVEVSWIARRWDLGTSAVTEGGLYVSDIDFDVNGNVIGLAEDPTVPLVDPVLVADDDGNLQPDIVSHDWSPDGLEVVYADTARQLVIADLVSGSSTLVGNSNLASSPTWSPDLDDSKIAFITYTNFVVGNIVTIDPDGSAERIILRGQSAKLISVSGPRWSPTGTHLVYRRFNLEVSSSSRSDVYRATSTGKQITNLTALLDTNPLPDGFRASPVAWRGD